MVEDEHTVAEVAADESFLSIRRTMLDLFDALDDLPVALGDLEGLAEFRPTDSLVLYAALSSLYAGYIMLHTTLKGIHNDLAGPKPPYYWHPKPTEPYVQSSFKDQLTKS